MRIAIDIDSTLHHYWDQFAHAAKRRFGVELPYEEQLWHIDRLRPEQVKACVEETHSEAQILAAKPYADAVETIRAWKQAGHFIHITSHRDTAAHDATERWLDRIGLPYDELYCSFDKVSHCRAIGIELLIDDSPVNLTRAADEGILGATLIHPWNEEVVDGDRIVGADDWNGLRKRLAPELDERGASRPPS